MQVLASVLFKSIIYTSSAPSLYCLSNFYNFWLIKRTASIDIRVACCSVFVFEVLTTIGNFCIYSIVVGMMIDIFVIYLIKHRGYWVTHAYIEDHGFIEFVMRAAAEKHLHTYNGALMSNVDQNFRMISSFVGAMLLK
uniref:Polyadenylate-binding protein RBP45 n=1 Tax=Tanacetum cinerariifolium TaxID=118510 RepID=A0A699HE99_TANCI|nr:polyadenylate-binding protein RBP45 [Tanacetum cinerariifolium]